MATVFTLNIRDRSFDAQVSSFVQYKIWPLANNDGKTLKIIRDTAGNIVRGGHAEGTVNGDTALVAVPNLPDPRDPDFDPDGFGFKVWVKTRFWQREAYFGAAELDLYEANGVLELEDVTDTDPAAFQASVSYAEQGDLEAEASARSDADATLTTALGTKVNSSTYTAGLATKADTTALTTETTRATAAEVALQNGTNSTFETRLSNAFGALALPSGVASPTTAKTFDPVRYLYNAKPGAFRNFRRKLGVAQAGLGFARLHVDGDSNTLGYLLANYRQQAYYNRLKARFGQMPSVTAKEGLIWLTSGLDPTDTRIVLGTGWSGSGAAGLFNTCVQASAGTTGNLAVTPDDPWDSATVYFARNSGLGTFQVNVDGGANTAANTSAAASIGSVTVAAGASGTHTLNLTTVTGNVVFPVAVEFRNGASGLLVSRGGVNSQKYSTLTYGSNPYDSRYAQSTASPDLTTFMFATNEWVQQESVATMKAAAAIAIATAKTTGDVLVIVPGPPSGAPTIPWSAYVQACYDIADTNDVPLLDFNSFCKDYATVASLMSDDKHLGAALHYSLSELIYGAVMG